MKSLVSLPPLLVLGRDLGREVTSAERNQPDRTQVRG